MIDPDLSQEIDEILDNCDTGTPRALVVWAAGARFMHHALHLAHLPLDCESVSKSTGSCSAGHRPLETSPKGVSVWTMYRQQLAVPVVLWSEIAKVMTLAKVGEQLHQQIQEALKLRRQRAISPDPRKQALWNDTPEARTAAQLWHEAETQCYRLAGLAWWACYPGPRRPAAAADDGVAALFKQLMFDFDSLTVSAFAELMSTHPAAEHAP